MITLAPPTIPTRRGLAVVQLRDDLWRITRTSGDVLGYVEAFGVPGAARFRAKRMLVQQRRFLVIGEFWTMDDALDSLRF